MAGYDAPSNAISGGAGGSGVVIVRYPTGVITATGGTITTVGPYTLHTFTGSGTFTVTGIGGVAVSQASALIVGGGGSGGGGWEGGGGGAGGVIQQSGIPIAMQSSSVIVGGGAVAARRLPFIMEGTPAPSG